MCQAAKQLFDFCQLPCSLFLILLQTFFGLCDRGNQIKSCTCAATGAASCTCAATGATSCTGAATADAVLKLLVLFQFYSYKALNLVLTKLPDDDIAFVTFFILIVNPEFCPLAAAQSDGFFLTADRVCHTGIYGSI